MRWLTNGYTMLQREVTGRNEMAIKTEHTGAKRGGSGFWGVKKDAKKTSKKLRRAADKKACRNN